MKKLVLSSIIMLGVCGAVNAQNATGSKIKNNAAGTSSSVAPTPQKAAIMPTDATAAPSGSRTAADKEAAAVNAPAVPQTKAEMKAAQAAAAVQVDAAGVVVSDEQKTKTEKPQAVKKNQQ